MAASAVAAVASVGVVSALAGGASPAPPLGARVATAQAPTAGAPPTFVITATGSKKKPAFSAPTTAPAGAVQITLRNRSKGGLDGQLVQVTGGQDFATMRNEAKKVMGRTVKPVADWFRAAGGPGATAPGKSSSITLALQPGTYYVVGSGEDGGLPTKAVRFTVAGGEGAAAPAVERAIIAKEYGYTATGLRPGRAKVELRNAGKEWHHFLTARLAPGKTLADARRFFMSEGRGKPPFAGSESEGLSSTVIEGGRSQTVDIDFKAGRHVIFCFIADRKGGPPHIAKGMISQVRIPMGG